MSIEVLPADEHDQALVAHVHPPDWVNPPPAERYNRVVIGKRGLGTIANTIHPYPTQAEAIKKLGDAYTRTKLTPLFNGYPGRGNTPSCFGGRKDNLFRRERDNPDGQERPSSGKIAPLDML
jgi:hypothetical protein